jgi:hypothetical protein
MKRIFTAIITAGLMIGFLVTGCEAVSHKMIENENEKIDAAQQELKDARLNYLAQWDAFKLETECEIAINQKRIDVIRDIMIKARPQAKKKYGKDLAGWEQINRELKMTLEGFVVERQDKDNVCLFAGTGKPICRGCDPEAIQYRRSEPRNAPAAPGCVKGAMHAGLAHPRTPRMNHEILPRSALSISCFNVVDDLMAKPIIATR